MKADQARLKDLVTQTIALMCKNGLEFGHDVRVEGLLAVTVDGTDIFVIHMDEKITGRPLLYAAGSTRYAETTAQRQERSDSAASSSASEADETTNPIDDLLPPTVGDVNERSSAIHIEDMRTVKTENAEEDSDTDDVMIVESEIGPLSDPNIPLAAVQGLNQREVDDGSCHTSPVSKKSRKSGHKRTSLGDIVLRGNTSDGHMQGDADVWMASVPHSSDVVSVSQPRSESDIYQQSSSYSMLPHTSSFLPANASQPSTSEITVPANILSSRVIRDALAEFVVNPLICKAGRSAFAFRVTWRHNNPVELDKAWLEIHQRRQTCDEVVSRQANVDFFFSCITGMYTKRCPRYLASAFGVMPSVSYYVVGDVVDDLLFSSIHSVMFTAELKLITGRPTNSAAVSDVHFVAAPLYRVVKDHSSKYVKQQLIRSWQATNDNNLENGVLSLPIAKLVTVNFKLTGMINSAYDLLKVAAPSFVIHLEHASS